MPKKKEVVNGFFLAGEEPAPPKRVLDGLLRYLVQGDQTILKEIRAGKTPLEALDAYSKQIRSIFQKTQYGKYTSEDLMKVSKIIQDKLKTLPTNRPTVTLSGSFPNFKAKLGQSDIDILDLDPNLKASLDKTLVEIDRHFSHQWSFSFEPHQEGLLDKTPISLFPETSSQHIRTLTMAQFMGLFNPVQIRITPDRIELLVYRSFNVSELIEPEAFLLSH